eukprot:1162011-Pelagomonas_calceolata.AAC.2
MNDIPRTSLSITKAPDFSRSFVSRGEVREQMCKSPSERTHRMQEQNNTGSCQSSACKLVPRHHGRGLENYNVLAPYISQPFMLMLKTVCIPSFWKAAKVAPIYEKGTWTYPSNYQMLAVSNTLYLLYTNFLRSMVQDWCAKRNIIPDNQFGFPLGRNTLQPLLF